MEPDGRLRRLSSMRKMGAGFLIVVIAAASASCGLGGASDLIPEGADAGALETADPNPTPLPEISPSEPPLPFHFLALGDFGTGGTEQQQIADRMCAWREKKPFDLVVTTGDNIYDSGEPRDFESKFFEPYDCLLSNGVKFHSTLGNHDIATQNGLPELNEPAFGMEARNYVIRRAGVRFVFVNSNDLRLDWLKQALTTDTEDLWTIVSFHHPVFSGGNEHGPTDGFGDTLPGLFARKGVDLVLNGHDHVYSVTQEVKGVRYVVTGGGGARGYGCQASPKVVECLPKYHFLSITVHPTEITVKALPRFGRAIHRFTTDGV